MESNVAMLTAMAECAGVPPAMAQACPSRYSCLTVEAASSRR
jgi:hypothetical protein